MDNYIFPFLWMRGESEEIIRKEIEKIYECGIRALCVEARPHDDFCGPGWWRDMDIVIHEAKKRNMKIWILDDKHFPTGYAAGLIENKYPERKKWYLADTTADVFGSGHERTLNVERMKKPVIGYWQITEDANWEERKNNRLIALTAAKFVSENTFSEETIDLTDRVKDGYATFNLPEGQWRIHAIYKTRTDGGNEAYINMLDRVSAHTQIEGVYETHYSHYPEEFGKTIAGFFSDEPELGNISLPRDDIKVGTKGIPLPWSDELEEMLKNRWQENYLHNLTFLFADSEKMLLCPQIRYDYMDCVTRLYENNFSAEIGKWCREHGVEYIGHVVEDNGSHSRMGHGPGHWFRAMTGQDMAGIDVIGNQVIFGAPVQTRKGMGGMELDGEFFHYILGKLGASSGHLDPLKKGRTMCELFGAYGWNFGVRDMRYLLDHLFVRGVNHLVPHAFSMAQYPDPDCPPHFYARGNNGQFPWFKHLMKYANRMCRQLNDGTHQAEIAVLYDAEADWTGDHMPMQKIGKMLLNNQIDFDVISCDMLRDPEAYNGSFDGNTLVINGVAFHALLIPYSQFLPASAADFIRRSDSFKIIFAEGYPDRFLQDGKSETEDIEPNSSCLCIKMTEIPDYLRKTGFCRISAVPSFEMLTVYHYKKTGQIYMIMNESADEMFRGCITIPSSEPVYCYDAENDEFLKIDSVINGNRSDVNLILEPGQSILLEEEIQVINEGYNAAGSASWKSYEEQIAECNRYIDMTTGWSVQLCNAKDYPDTVKEFSMDKLAPISETETSFSGIIRYSRSFTLDHKPVKAVFTAENVFEVMRVRINEEKSGMKITTPYQIDITDKIKTGENTILVEIANTPGRDQLNYPAPAFDFQHDCLEPSGMFGKVGIFVKED